MAKITLKCEKCKKNLVITFNKGVVVTGSLYEAAAKKFAFTAVENGYICGACKEKEGENG